MIFTFGIGILGITTFLLVTSFFGSGPRRRSKSPVGTGFKFLGFLTTLVGRGWVSKNGEICNLMKNTLFSLIPEPRHLQSHTICQKNPLNLSNLAYFIIYVDKMTSNVRKMIIYDHLWYSMITEFAYSPSSIDCFS